jgi:excisionase family DNA binding protein
MTAEAHFQHPANLTPKQAAEFLQVPETTLSIWRTTNRVRLPYFKLGRSVRYRLKDLQAFIESQMHAHK